MNGPSKNHVVSAERALQICNQHPENPSANIGQYDSSSGIFRDYSSFSVQSVISLFSCATDFLDLDAGPDAPGMSEPIQKTLEKAATRCRELPTYREYVFERVAGEYLMGKGFKVRDPSGLIPGKLEPFLVQVDAQVLELRNLANPVNTSEVIAHVKLLGEIVRSMIGAEDFEKRMHSVLCDLEASLQHHETRVNALLASPRRKRQEQAA